LLQPGPVSEGIVCIKFFFRFSLASSTFPFSSTSRPPFPSPVSLCVQNPTINLSLGFIAGLYFSLGFSLPVCPCVFFSTESSPFFSYYQFLTVGLIVLHPQVLSFILFLFLCIEEVPSRSPCDGSLHSLFPPFSPVLPIPSEATPSPILSPFAFSLHQC